MEKKYILIKKYQKFYDGHGDSDDGASVVSVEFTNQYNDFDLTGKKIYDDNDESYDDYESENSNQAEDGYNCEIWLYTYKEITKEEYEQYSIIIEKYNSLFRI